jgi:CubicO group peptidase (beta-lactamase class C family)
MNGELRAADAVASCPAAGDEWITETLGPIRAEFKVPAMAAAVVTSRGMLALGAVGVRKRGMETAATVDDRWHLGSDTKAMTATLMAVLVERGSLTWDSTLAEVFPDLADRMSDQLRQVTLLHLLAHHAGLPENVRWSEFEGPAPLPERRREIMQRVASMELAGSPGAGYRYSNLGYVIAAAMAERVTDKSWEHLMQREVFSPLGLRSVGYGGTGTPGDLDQPWGHHDDGLPAQANGPMSDNPLVMAPAGGVHCSLADWAKFIADQLRGARGAAGLLRARTYRRLHTPPFGGDYALGWVVAKRGWGGGTVLHHAGSNTMNYANVWVAPARDFAVLICVNQGGDAAFKASDAAVAQLVQRHAERGIERSPAPLVLQSFRVGTRNTEHGVSRYPTTSAWY